MEPCFSLGSLGCSTGNCDLSLKHHRNVSAYANFQKHNILLTIPCNGLHANRIFPDDSHFTRVATLDTSLHDYCKVCEFFVVLFSALNVLLTVGKALYKSTLFIFFCARELHVSVCVCVFS